MLGRFYIPKGILLVTLPQHLFGLGGALYFLSTDRASAWWLIYAYLAWVCIGVLGVGIFYHKYFAHRSFNTFRWVEILGAYLGCLAGLGAPTGWVALHNDNHHKHADRNEHDVHSPIHGKFNAYMGWQFRRLDLRLHSAKAMLRDPVMRLFSRHYFKIYWASALLLGCIDLRLPVFLLLLPGCVHYHVEGFISCFCHLRAAGYRNFDTPDDSVNIFWLGVLTWGAGFHNNHHRLLRATHYQVKPWEIDLSRMLMLLIPKKASTSSD